MYRLQSVHAGVDLAREEVEVPSATDVMSFLPDLVARHPDCTRIAVLAGPTHLFAVGADGQRIDD